MISHVLWLPPGENVLAGLPSFTVVVIANGYHVYSLFLVQVILWFTMHCNVWHICSNMWIILCSDVAY